MTGSFNLQVTSNVFRYFFFSDVYEAGMKACSSYELNYSASIPVAF